MGLPQTLGFEKYRRAINRSPQSMQDARRAILPVNVAIPPTAPSREDIMYQGPGGCIVGKYNVTKKTFVYRERVFSDCLEGC